MVLLGSGEYRYEVSGDNWGSLPEGAVYREATAVDVSADDSVYVFNRGTHPMVVFNTEGEVIRTWGHGIFTNPHGVTVAPDGTIWCVDNGDHTVRAVHARRRVAEHHRAAGHTRRVYERQAVQRAHACGV